MFYLIVEAKITFIIPSQKRPKGNTSSGNRNRESHTAIESRISAKVAKNLAILEDFRKYCLCPDAVLW